MNGLIRQAEDFFRQEVAGDQRNAAVVLTTSTGMLPEAGEVAASLGARCAVVLAAAEGDSVGGGRGEWVGDLMDLPAAEFGMIAKSWAKWSVHDHDHLYRIVDQYLQERMLSEEEQMDICSTINCRTLSHRSLSHLLQNSTLPLRFVLQAALVGQLETSRRSASFSSILDATALRIESLERDVAGLRRHLRWSEEKRAEMESARSESFRFPHMPPPSKKAGGFHRRLVHGLRSIFRPSAVAESGSRGANGSRDG